MLLSHPIADVMLAQSGWMQLVNTLDFTHRPGCAPEGGCCSRRILFAERGFQDQKGRLQEEIEAKTTECSLP